MLKWPQHLLHNKVFEISGKFNSILEECLNDGKAENHKIMSIEVDPADFDFAGNLTLAGMKVFWKGVDKAMQCFDVNDITLNPRKN